jgi:hypothetical protein
MVWMGRNSPSFLNALGQPVTISPLALDTIIGLIKASSVMLTWIHQNDTAIEKLSSLGPELRRFAQPILGFFLTAQDP